MSKSHTLSIAVYCHLDDVLFHHDVQNAYSFLFFMQVAVNLKGWENWHLLILHLANEYLKEGQAKC